MASRDGALTLSPWYSASRPGWKLSRAVFPVPQTAPVLSVVSPPKHRMSISAETSSVAEEVPGCHPEGSDILEVPFVQRGYWEGLFQGLRDPWPPCQLSSLLQMQLPDFRLERGTMQEM
jgi:hypothetical protein